MPTNEAPILPGQSQLGSHGYFSRNLHVTLRQLRVFMNDLSGETEEDADALQGYLLRGVHFNNYIASFPLSFY